MAKINNLRDFLENKRSPMVKRWMGVLLETYSEQAAVFMKSKTNQFENPVGATLRRSLEGLYDLLVKDFDPDQAAPLLDGIIRIRAIQDFAASDSLAFIFQFKDIIRKALGKAAADVVIARDLERFFHDIDRMALLGFDLYVGCRNQLADIRIKEMERQNHMAWRRAGFLEEDQIDPPVKTGS